MININKNPPWFRTAARCRYSGLPVSHAQLFVSHHPDTNYFVDVAKLGEMILLVKGSGDVRFYEMEDALRYMDAYAKKHFDMRTGVFIIENYADIGRVDFKARKSYIEHHKHSDIFWGAVFYHMPRLMRFSFQIAQRLHIQGKDAYSVDSYKQAITFAQEIISRRNNGHFLKDEGVSSSAPCAVNTPGTSEKNFSYAKGKFGKFKLKFPRHFKEKVTRHYSETLLNYIESIDWNKDGMVPIEIDEVENEDVKQVFEAISYIKSEIDDLLKEREAAEKDLREREAQYRQLVEHAKAGIMQYDYHTCRAISVNESLLELTGYSQEEFMNMDPLDLMTEESRKIYNDRLAQIMSGKVVSPESVYAFCTRNGGKKWVQLNTNIIYEDGWPCKADIIVTDITPLKEAENELISYQSKLRELGAKLSKSEESQRRQLASQLHESVSQELFVAQLKLNVLEKSLQTDACATQINEIRQQIVKSIREIKAITYDLSPPVLYELGLIDAVKSLVQSAEKKYGLKIKARFNDDLADLEDEIKFTAYRVIKEVLQNAVKHAEADLITMVIEKKGGRLKIAVTDNGIGFDVNRLSQGYYSVDGFGLFDIREKITHLGGEVTIHSTPGFGTRVSLSVPVSDTAFKSRVEPPQTQSASVH